MRERSLRAAHWLSVLTALLATVGSAGALRLFGALGLVPLIWSSVPSIAGIACYAGVRGRHLPLAFASIGLLWSVAILGMWSVGVFFAPAALAGALTAVALCIGSPSTSAASMVWFGIGLTAICAFDVLYARSQSYELRYPGGFSASRVGVPPIVAYGAGLFLVLISTVTAVAIIRKLMAARR